mgnify:CR=1 FL=1
MQGWCHRCDVNGVVGCVGVGTKHLTVSHVPAGDSESGGVECQDVERGRRGENRASAESSKCLISGGEDVVDRRSGQKGSQCRAYSSGCEDAVFAAAEAHDQLLIPVLAPQDGACEGDVFKGRQWYVDGWTAPPTAPALLSFEQWMNTAVDRWKDSPVLAAWELIGEPETSTCTDAACSWWTRTCTPDAAAILRNFFDSAGAGLRAHDSQTLITAGLTGGGQCGSQGDEYGYLAESPFVDVLQYHDYGADGVPLPGDQWNGLARRIAQSSDVGKPLLVAEIGENAGSCKDIGERATSIETKITGQRSAGTAGALLWAFVPDPRPQECTFDIGPEDPLWQVITAVRWPALGS